MKNKILIPVILLAVIITSFSLASALSISQVSSYPDEIQPGGKSSVTLTIENKGDRAEEISVSLNLNGASIQLASGLQQVYAPVPFSPYQSSSTQSIERINKDKTQDVSFDLIANSDADSGIYKIPVDISYKVDNASKKDSGVISLIVNAKPKLSVSSDNSGVIKGQSNDVNIKIVNSGLGDAKFLSVKVEGISNARIIGADNFYIGNLNNDDFDSVKLSLFPVSGSANSINIPLIILYKDSRNKDYAESFNLQVKSYTLQEAINAGLIQKSYTSIIVLIVVILIVAYIVYRIIRGILRRRKKNQEM
ncbi:hypothetical protein FJZ19_00960 [Candidatus Pacearchaeota archaeon]|nr:hypothetical protein [Candidatus Pacearchaeota archaeon]